MPGVIQHPDVAIVGAGINGLLCAWQLAQAGFRVRVYEAAAQVGAGATGHSLGGLVPFGWSRQHSLAQQQRQSLQLWPAIAAQLHAQTGIDIGYRQLGRLQMLDSPGQFAAAQTDAAASGGLQTILTPAQVQAREAQVAPTPYGALYCATTASVRVRSLLAALVQATQQAMQHAGGEILFEHPITRLQDITARLIILTSGVGTAALVPEFPVVPVKGQALRLSVSQPLFGHLVRQREVYLIPVQEGGQHLVLVGATTEPDAGWDIIPTVTAREQLCAKAACLVPQLASAQVVGHWAGLRPKGPAGAALVTHITARVWVATGHYKIGLCLAPLVAQTVVARAVAAGYAPNARPNAW